MGYNSITKRGNVNAGEYDFILKPHDQRAQNVGVVMFHGSGHPYAMHDTTQPYSSMLAGLIANAGIPVVSAEFGGQAWGNPNAMTLGDNAITYMNAVCGTRTDKVIVMGGSMGAYTALRFAKMNPTKVLAVAGMVPLTNMTYFYANVGGTADDEIAAAWGVAVGSALPAASQIQEVAGTAFTDIPIKLWYSSSDAIVRPIDTTNFIANCPSATGVNVGTNGHSDKTVNDIINYGAGDGKDVINFLKANGA